MSNNFNGETIDSNRPTLIANRYRLLQKLGAGAFGEVFLADDLKFDPPRAIAIKLLHSKFLNEPEVRADIAHEASVLARFNHPNILRVIDFDISPGQAFIVTELAEGGSLARKIRPDPNRPAVRMPLNEVVYYLEQICDALDEAHSAGLIHRDLKPLNILLDKRGRPLVADFGMATAVSNSQSSIMVDASTSGTPPYMAPEQWMGHVGRASDIYALGIITYLLISGQLPYQGDQHALGFQHINAPIPRLSERAPDLVYPSALDYVLAGALAKDPRQRTRPAMEFFRRFKAAVYPTVPTIPSVTPPPPLINPTIFPANHDPAYNARPVNHSPDTLTNRPGEIGRYNPVPNTPPVSRAPGVTPSYRKYFLPGLLTILAIILIAAAAVLLLIITRNSNEPATSNASVSVTATVPPLTASVAAKVSATTNIGTTSLPVIATTSNVATTAAVTTAAVASGSASISALPTLGPFPAGAPTGGTFSYISAGGALASHLHPYPSITDYSQSAAEAGALIWDGAMVEYDYTNLKWNLRFARDMRVSPDSKTYIFTLRDGLKWSDGSDVTVADYQYAYDNAIKEDTANPNNNFSGLDDLKKISLKTDAAARTLTFTLDNSYAADLALSYLAAVLPVPSKVWSGKPWYNVSGNPEITRPAVVSGPYTVQSATPSQIVFKSNANWWRGKSIYDTINFTAGTATTALPALRAGQADYTANLPLDQYPIARADPSLTVYNWSAINGTFRFIEYNLRRAPLNDKALRVAINYAIDRDNLISLVEGGLGTAQTTFINQQNFYYNRLANSYQFNLATAKKTLADAGYKQDSSGKLLGKDGKPLTLTIVYPTSSNPRRLIAAYLQQQLLEIGITVNVDGKEFNTYLDQVVKQHNFDISLNASGGGLPDPDSFKSYAVSNGANNDAGYSNSQLDTLFQQGALEIDPTRRKALYDLAQQVLNDDTPYFFLWNINNFEVFSKKVQAVQPGFKGLFHGFINDGLTRWYNLTS